MSLEIGDTYAVNLQKNNPAEYDHLRSVYKLNKKVIVFVLCKIENVRNDIVKIVGWSLKWPFGFTAVCPPSEIKPVDLNAQIDQIGNQRKVDRLIGGLRVITEKDLYEIYEKIHKNSIYETLNLSEADILEINKRHDLQTKSIQAAADVLRATSDDFNPTVINEIASKMYTEQDYEKLRQALDIDVPNCVNKLALTAQLRYHTETAALVQSALARIPEPPSFLRVNPVEQMFKRFTEDVEKWKLSNASSYDIPTIRERQEPVSQAESNSPDFTKMAKEKQEQEYEKELAIARKYAWKLTPEGQYKPPIFYNRREFSERIRLLKGITKDEHVIDAFSFGNSAVGPLVFDSRFHLWDIFNGEKPEIVYENLYTEAEVTTYKALSDEQKKDSKNVPEPRRVIKTVIPFEHGLRLCMPCRVPSCGRIFIADHLRNLHEAKEMYDSDVKIDIPHLNPLTWSNEVKAINEGRIQPGKFDIRQFLKSLTKIGFDPQAKIDENKSDEEINEVENLPAIEEENREIDAVQNHAFEADATSVASTSTSTAPVVLEENREIDAVQNHAFEADATSVASTSTSTAPVVLHPKDKEAIHWKKRHFNENS